MSPSAFHVREGRWPDEAPLLESLRREVFVDEQGVPPEIEWDGQDPQCRHVVALDAEGRAIGCGRLLPDGHIGRLAVRRNWRGQGVGAALLDALIELARGDGHREVALNAQTHALAFYARRGFAPSGEPFIEAGIPHQAMAQSLA